MNKMVPETPYNMHLKIKISQKSTSRVQEFLATFIHKNTEYLVPTYISDNRGVNRVMVLVPRIFNTSVDIFDGEKTKLSSDKVSFSTQNYNYFSVKTTHAIINFFPCCKNHLECTSTCPSQNEIYPEGRNVLAYLYVKWNGGLTGDCLISSTNNQLFKINDEENFSEGIVLPLFSDSNIIIKFDTTTISILWDDHSTWRGEISNIEFQFKTATINNFGNQYHQYVVHYYTPPSESKTHQISLLVCGRRNLTSRSCDLGSLSTRFSSHFYSRAFIPYKLYLDDQVGAVLDVHIREYGEDGQLDTNTDSSTLHILPKNLAESLLFEFCRGYHCLIILPDPFILDVMKHELKLKFVQNFMFKEQKITFCHIFDDIYCLSKITPGENGIFTVVMDRNYPNIILVMLYNDYKFPIIIQAVANTSTYYEFELEEDEFELQMEFIALSVEPKVVEQNSLINTREDTGEHDCGDFEKTSKRLSISLYILIISVFPIAISICLWYYYIYRPIKARHDHIEFIRQFD